MNEQSQYRRVFVADVGGTNLRAAVVDEEGRILLRLKQKTPQGDSPDRIVQALVNAARQCDEQFADHPIESICVVVFGAVDVATGTIVRIPNWPGLNGFNLKQPLMEALGRPVLLENDANAAAVGEMWQGAARGRRTIVCVTLGTGVGGGIILDGKLWHGVNDSAGEIGHTCVEPFSDVMCSCGNRGCLEVYASATAMVRMAREGMEHQAKGNLNLAEELTAEKIYYAGKQGDVLALDVFHRVGFYLGISLANLVNVLSPEMIVIGGGGANGWDLFASEMFHQVRKRAFPLPAAEVKIVPAECGDDAGLLGAAWLALFAAADDATFRLHKGTRSAEP